MDASGNIFVTGVFGDNLVDYAVDLDQTGSGDVHMSNGERDVFVTMLQADGAYGWTRTFGGVDADFGTEMATGLPRNVREGYRVPIKNNALRSSVLCTGTPF